MRDAAPMTTRPAMLPLVDIADELGVGAIDPAAGRAQLLALELDTGEFDLPTLAIRAETRGLVTGYIVARGQLAAGVTLAGRTATQLLGPGDLLPVVSEEDELLPRALGFTVIQPAVLAVCDDRFHV